MSTACQQPQRSALTRDGILSLLPSLSPSPPSHLLNAVWFRPFFFLFFKSGCSNQFVLLIPGRLNLVLTRLGCGQFKCPVDVSDRSPDGETRSRGRSFRAVTSPRRWFAARSSQRQAARTRQEVRWCGLQSKSSVKQELQEVHHFHPELYLPVR